MAATASDRSRAGWAELAAGRWPAAREHFEASLETDETAEALEGLSWAAWWLDDAPAVFDARERAYRRYREDGDPAAAARMATWLASDHVDFHGATSVAQGWLQRAHRLLDSLEPGPDHGWLAFLEGYLAHARGDSRHAQELGRSAAELGRRFDVPDLEMLGLAIEGAALVDSGEVGDGMRRLDEATVTALAEQATVPISGAWACCFLVTACTATLDMDRAAEWCERINDFADRYGSRYMLAFCRSEYGTVYVWQGRWSQAEAMLESARDEYARSRPASGEGTLVGLAELRRRQGRYDEALELLDQAEAGTSAALVCRAALALDRGDADAAAELLERALRQQPAERKVGRSPAVRLLVRAQVARGELDRAEEALAELRELERAVGTAPLRASVALSEGMLAAARGEHEEARPLLEDAVDGFQRSGAPFEASVARIELARTLAALGRADAARREATTALETLEPLGAAAEAARARALAGSPGEDGALAELTAREREVVGLLAEGLTNREIAGRLVVSEHTVHRHVTNILRKLGVSSRTAAAAVAVQAGVLDDPGA